MTCPSCGAQAPEGARFCPSCGHPLNARADERRVVTVLFADLVGFTTLSEARDPEQVKNLIDRCFSRLAADVEAFGGQVDKIVGDAIVALFGAPVAHEDDAERAVRAALQMQQTMADLAAESAAATADGVKLRVGVNTGEVLVGSLRAGGDYTAMGDVVNVASRLQSQASPGDVVVGPGTYYATRAIVQYEPLGSVPVRNREEPVDMWRAIGAIAPPGHRPRRKGMPLVGRDAELGVLCNAMTLALTRQRAHLALVLGEAGIGKSRLAEEVSEVAAGDHCARVLEGRCLPYGEANVWWPIAEALRQASGINPDDDAATTAVKVRAAVAEALGQPDDGPDVEHVTGGLLYFMGQSQALADVDAGRARDDARWSLEAFLEAIVARRPMVLRLSELHWADPLVLDLIDHLLDHLRSLPFVLLGTARPELEERWTPAAGRFNQVVIHLDPLPAEAAKELLTALLGDEPTPELRDLLLERSGGNPFFLEELVALLGDDVRPSELPATLRGLVSARLDALSARERAVLEDAAVVGRSGLRAAIVALADARGDTAAEALIDQLTAKELLTVDGAARDPRFEFRSELVREVAYETLTKGERARRHAALAGLIETRLRQIDREDEFLEMLAHHYGTAAEVVLELGFVDGVHDDINKRALHAIEAAAHRAKQRELPRASLRLLDLALRLLPSEAQDHRRLVLLERAKVKTALRDLPGARADLAAGIILAEQAQDECDLARALTIRGEIEQKEGDYLRSEATLTEAVEKLRRHTDGHEYLLGEALRQRGMTRLFGGKTHEAEVDIEEALAHARDVGARQQEAWALWSLAWNAFVQSRLGDAEHRLHEAHTLFREIGDWGAAAWARGLLGWVRYFQGRRKEAGELAAGILVKSYDTGDRWARAMTLVLLSSVQLWEGDTDESIEPAREAVQLFLEIDDNRGLLQASGSLARSLAAAGRIDEANRVMEVALEKVNGPIVEATTGVMVATSLLQLGEADRALQRLVEEGVEVNMGGDMGRSEGRALIGLALLQLGDARHALGELQPAYDHAPADGPKANAAALLGLARVCLGEPEAALAVVATVPETESSTYADRSMAALVTGLANVHLGRPDEAVAAFDQALSIADGTGDRLLQAVLRFGAAEGMAVLEHPASIGLRDEAEIRLGAMGVAAAGWRNLFRLAASAAASARTAS